MKSTRRELEEVRFHNPQLDAVGVEVLHLKTLRTRVSTEHLATPQRVKFYMLLFVAEGYLRHVVDFGEMRLGTGSLVIVQPGQVQHWHLDDRCDGCMVLIDPPALKPMVLSRGNRDILLESMNEWPVGVRLDEAFAEELRIGLDCLARDLAEFDGTDQDITLIRQCLLVLLLRVARWHRRRTGGHEPRAAGARHIFKLFEAEVDRYFREHRTVDFYASRLGYSESTLNRACRAATGQSAKVLLDRRLAMEAARMLVHSQATVAEIGYSLGYSEPTNFVRFFGRLVGVTPLEFRRQHSTAPAKPGLSEN